MHCSVFTEVGFPSSLNRISLQYQSEEIKENYEGEERRKALPDIPQLDELSLRFLSGKCRKWAGRKGKFSSLWSESHLGFPSGDQLIEEYKGNLPK